MFSLVVQIAVCSFKVHVAPLLISALIVRMGYAQIMFIIAFETNNDHSKDFPIYHQNIPPTPLPNSL